MSAGDDLPGQPPPPSGGESEATMSESRSTWLWDHTGRIAGLALGALAFASMVFLAAIGFRPALYLVVLLVVGVATIAIGGRIKGA
ncbi:MAG: hypothetical protein JWO62_2125 [Acidimicrobiaceae bacterium]|jgi:hypothetical protein|nr:hypothetical protein [Acidimicrobiaceae bacterium]